MVKIPIFGQNCPKNFRFLPENDDCTQIPSVELAEATFIRFPKNIFQIARHFFQKSVIFGALYLAI